MPTRNISLTRQFARFVAKKIAGNRCENASQVIHAGLESWSARNSNTTPT
jgi:Arc/MetJ-type ribon-helix-helix transcriptional regulator